MTDKERYATIGTWEKVFREEGISISEGEIRRRLRDESIVGMTARSRTGRLLKNGFYPESVIREHCADLLQDLPQADADDTFEKDGETYGTIRSFSRSFGISREAVQKRISKNGLSPVRGRLKGGQSVNFYALSELRIFCTDLLQDLPQAGEGGTFERNGEIYGTFKSLSQLLGVSSPTIQLKVKKSTLVAVQGKLSGGQLGNFYPLSAVRRLCEDLLQELPQADENGTFKKDGETYGTIASLSGLLGIADQTSRSKVNKSTLAPVQGKLSGGQLRDFYSLSEFRGLCEDLLLELPQVNEDGIFEKGGECYGSLRKLAETLGISSKAILRRMEGSEVTLCRGRSIAGCIITLYSLSGIRRLCEDLLQDIPQADEYGTFEKDGETYGNIKSLARLLGVSSPTVQSRVRQAGFRSIKGKNITGRIFAYYHLDEVRELCADLIAKKSQKQ